jgi:GxxExxY protein
VDKGLRDHLKRDSMGELIYKDEAYAIVGAAMEVHRTLGCGFLEVVYQEALALEFSLRNIPYFTSPEIQIVYKGISLKKTFFLDFLVFDKIIVEIKALDTLTGRERAQLLNYLKAANLELGLLINFGAQHLQSERMINTPVLKTVS